MLDSERHGRGQGIGTSRRRKGDRAEDGRRCTSGRQTGTGDAGSADAGQIDACVGYCSYVASAPLGFVGVVWILWDWVLLMCSGFSWERMFFL